MCAFSPIYEMPTQAIEWEIRSQKRALSQKNLQTDQNLHKNTWAMRSFCQLLIGGKSHQRIVRILFSFAHVFLQKKKYQQKSCATCIIWISRLFFQMTMTKIGPLFWRNLVFSKEQVVFCTLDLVVVFVVVGSTIILCFELQLMILATAFQIVLFKQAKWQAKRDADKYQSRIKKTELDSQFTKFFKVERRTEKVQLLLPSSTILQAHKRFNSFTTSFHINLLKACPSCQQAQWCDMQRDSIQLSFLGKTYFVHRFDNDLWPKKK